MEKRVERLGDVAGSLRELVRLLEWLEQHGTHLVAADVELDTSTAAGRRTVALLKEIERWERPAGRPGIKSGHPELAERIAALRERGLSLHAIAETLNTEDIPTPRGGTRWRASSVQSVLGYRRPHPPPHGAPPSPPPSRPGPRHARTPRARPADRSGPPHKNRPRP